RAPTSPASPRVTALEAKALPYSLVAEADPRTGVKAAVRLPLSPLEVHQVLEDLVRGGDDLGVGLEPALGHDQVGELLSQVDVAHLQGAAGQRAPSAVAGHTDGCRTRAGVSGVHRPRDLLEPGRVGERRHRDLAEGLPHPVGEDSDELAAGVEGEGL